MPSFRFPQHGKEDAEKYTRLGWWPGITFGDLLDKVTDANPGKEALVENGIRLTYSELRENVDRLALGFMNLGIDNGDTVLLQLPNWAEFVYSFFAVQKIGGIPVLLVPGYRRLEVSHLCQLTEAKAWIVPDLYRKIDYLSFIDEVKQANPQLEHVISARPGRIDGKFTANLGKLMERGLTAEDRQRLESRKPEPTDICHILPSGGTTGLPKGIPRTHNDYLCNVEYVARAGEMSHDDVWIVVAPVGHNQGLLVGVSGSILMGGKLVLLDSTRVEDICHTIERERVTFMPIVPSLLKRIIDFEKMGDYDLTSLKKISAGGEASSPELVRQVNSKLDCKYINEFGMSEGLLCRTRVDDDLDTICHTVGRPCCPGDHLRILDEDGNGLPDNVEGELAAKGPSIFAGYMKNPDEDEQVFTSDGFFRTGDLARLDKSGNVIISGRIKDIIIRGGENISPAQVENILLSHPGIADVAVIGMPDEALGERVCAYVQPVIGIKLDSEEIITFMDGEGASKLLIPERFEFVDHLPMTEVGKHDKKSLREDIKRRMGKR